MKRIKRNRKHKLRHNAAIKQISNYLLAAAIGLTATAGAELFASTSRFTLFEVMLFVTTGFLSLLVSCYINFLLEDPDE